MGRDFGRWPILTRKITSDAGWSERSSVGWTTHTKNKEKEREKERVFFPFSITCRRRFARLRRCYRTVSTHTQDPNLHLTIVNWSPWLTGRWLTSLFRLGAKSHTKKTNINKHEVYISAFDI